MKQELRKAKVRNVTIQDSDWVKLEELVDILGLRSVSALITFLGNKEYRKQKSAIRMGG